MRTSASNFDIKLVQDWWEFWGVGKEQDLFSRTKPVSNRAVAVQQRIYELARDPDHLGELLEWLAAAAPKGERLKFVGTSILEDAYSKMGARAFQILEDSSLQPRQQKEILSGFLF